MRLFPLKLLFPSLVAVEEYTRTLLSSFYRAGELAEQEERQRQQRSKEAKQQQQQKEEGEDEEEEEETVAAGAGKKRAVNLADSIRVWVVDQLAAIAKSPLLNRDATAKEVCLCYGWVIWVDLDLIQSVCCGFNLICRTA